jgi:regulator of protease activity HflC (stomatin/prohibitin superfamily)
MSPFALIGLAVLAVALLIFIASTLKTVDQASVAVVTMFGKYRRVLNPGLNILIPFLEVIHSRVPVQNQTQQLQFSAITMDQAAVHFTATILYTVTDHTPETVQLVAFKFIDDRSFMVALTSAVEASVREFVAGKRQAEVLGLRSDIVTHAQATLDEQLASWGYTLVDLTVNDIAFDAEVMVSMSRVVAAKNSQAAAEFEGEALLITATKAAEAQGAAIQIGATAEAEAARLRGVGLANFRRELAQGPSDSSALLATHDVSQSMLAFTMWTETVRDAAREGTGNVVFLDASVNALDTTMRRLEGMLMVNAAPEVPTQRDGAHQDQLTD